MLEQPHKQRWNPSKVVWWYDALIDWMLENPQANKKEAAPVFGVSVNYIYMLTSTDLFKERFAERRNELSRLVHSEILERTGRVAIKGLTKIEERFGSEEKIPLQTLTDVTTAAMKALGYGLPQSPSVVVNNNNVVASSASATAIERAREEIRSEQARRLEAPQEIELTAEPAQEDLFEEEGPAPPSLAETLFGDDTVELVHEDA